MNLTHSNYLICMRFIRVSTVARYIDQTFFVTEDREKSTHPVEGGAAQESIDSVEGATAQEYY